MRDTHPLGETVAERVRRLMDSRRISGAELARRIGITQAYLSRRMTGRVDFRTADLEQIAQELEVPATDLLRAAAAP